MKRKGYFYLKIVCIQVLCLFLLTACGQQKQEIQQNAVQIELSDEEILVDGNPIAAETSNAVYAAKDIVYYEEGKDFTYGEGSEKDAHSAEEALAHTVVHIAEPGTYSVSGTLSLGQIAVDLGEDAKENPQAAVTLILNNADITCKVAPAVIFYNVYECGNTDAENATKDVDTSAAGANVIIADESINTVNGSYVARIYNPESVVLNKDKTEIEDAKKLHKYDGAFYSKMSMNIIGEEKNSGILHINAENEGLDSELHLTMNGGNINIQSGNDGINTNEDGVSVTTVNGGTLTINVTGETGEGDGIDSNGWLVINGGKVIASACSDSPDAGIDSDKGIYINGGTVIASGHMLDRIEEGGQTYAVFQFAQEQDGEETLYLKEEEEKVVFAVCPEKVYSVLIYSSPDLKEGTYTLWNSDRQLAGQSGGMMGGFGMPGMMPPEGFEGKEPPKEFEGKEFPAGMEPPEGREFPEGMEPPEGREFPEGMEPPEGREFPEMMRPDQGNVQAFSPEFLMEEGANMFGNVSCIE